MIPFKKYLGAVAQANGLTDKETRGDLEWVFYPGMLQDNNSMWWADFGRRATCHEGIDICLYRFGKGAVHALPPGANVPAMAPGRVCHVSKDLLGKSLVVSLKEENTNGEYPLMVYSHLDVDLQAGDTVDEGQLIGRTFDTRTKKSRLLSHLHVSCILVPGLDNPSDLTWKTFMDRDRVFHINPRFL